MRYSVFKAKWNQEYLSIEEEKVRELCEEEGIEPEQFLRDTDNPNRKWSYALIRFKRRSNPNWPKLFRGKSYFYRY